MSATDIVKRYFEAMGRQDLDAALAQWEPGGIERIVGGPELVAPGDIRDYFGALFAAFPDFAFEILETAAEENRVAVRWRAPGTFAGPGRFQGFEPNGAQILIEGCDLVTVSGDRITHNDAYLDSGEVARQLGFLPATGSGAEAALTKLANAGTKVKAWMQASGPEQVADGVWVLRGGFPLRTMNVYLIEDDGGVTVFDAGIMT
jgi:predicted ester cyclase